MGVVGGKATGVKVGKVGAGAGAGALKLQEIKKKASKGMIDLIPMAKVLFKKSIPP